MDSGGREKEPIRRRQESGKGDVPSAIDSETHRVQVASRFVGHLPRRAGAAPSECFGRRGVSSRPGGHRKGRHCTQSSCLPRTSTPGQHGRRGRKPPQSWGAGEQIVAGPCPFHPFSNSRSDTTTNRLQEPRNGSEKISTDGGRTSHGVSARGLELDSQSLQLTKGA